MVEGVRRLLILVIVFNIMRYASMCSSSANNLFRDIVAIEKSSGFLKCVILGLDDNCLDN
jgi:hypothetical protein